MASKNSGYQFKIEVFTSPNSRKVYSLYGQTDKPCSHNRKVLYVVLVW